jgi:hypothetical protein
VAAARPKLGEVKNTVSPTRYLCDRMMISCCTEAIIGCTGGLAVRITLSATGARPRRGCGAAALRRAFAFADFFAALASFKFFLPFERRADLPPLSAFFALVLLIRVTIAKNRSPDRTFYL